MEIRELLNKSVVDHPYVEMIIKNVTDKSLFKMSPENLVEKRKIILREHLKYLRDMSSFYERMFNNLGVNPDNATIDDIIKLAISSHQWRGDGIKKYLIPPVQGLAGKAERVDDREKYGKWFKSSGTGGRAPVNMYRSPIDLEIQEITSISMVANFLDSLSGGKGLILLAPELKREHGFIFGIEFFYIERGAEYSWGMRVDETVEANTIFAKLRPNKKEIASFIKSDVEPKFIHSAPIGIWQLIKAQDRLKELKGMKGYFARKMSGMDKPIDLGKGGAIITGGGTKMMDMPPFDELMYLAKDKIIARDENGNQIPAPWIDTLGMTENITLLSSCSKWKNGGLVIPDSLTKIPHPLSEVVLVDLRTQKIVEAGQEGEFLIYNPFNLSLLEAFYPGDIGMSHKTNSYYGQGYEFKRTLEISEGGMDRACGGAIEKMMHPNNIKEGENHAA